MHLVRMGMILADRGGTPEHPMSSRQTTNGDGGGRHDRCYIAGRRPEPVAHRRSIHQDLRLRARQGRPALCKAENIAARLATTRGQIPPVIGQPAPTKPMVATFVDIVRNGPLDVTSRRHVPRPSIGVGMMQITSRRQGECTSQPGGT